MLFYRLGIAAVMAVFLALPAKAQQLPLISTTNVEMIDVVVAKKAGASMIGSPLYAHRDGDTVRYFVSDENCAEYVAAPDAFPDVGRFQRLAFMGVDPVIFLPKGVHSPVHGAIVAGNPEKYRAVYKDAVYAFAYEATMRAFKADPAEYVPLVGGYCLGAMSQDHVTPGDPRNHLYIAEVNQWAMFGSPRGPQLFAQMSSDERLAAVRRAVVNYLRKTGQVPDKIVER